MAYEIILLDADDTLYDFGKAMEKALEKLFNYYGIAYTAENVNVYKKHNRISWDMFERGEIDKERLSTIRFELFLDEMGLNHLSITEVNDRYISFLGEGTYLIDGAEEVCKSLSFERTLVIATNGFEKSQMARFSNSSIYPYIDYVAISEKIGYPKPDGRFFDYALNICGCTDKSKVIMIGDSLNADIKGGINYGIDTCWYNPHNTELPEGIRPTYIISDLKEILDIVGAL